MFKISLLYIGDYEFRSITKIRKYFIGFFDKKIKGHKKYFNGFKNEDGINKAIFYGEPVAKRFTNRISALSTLERCKKLIPMKDRKDFILKVEES